MNKLINLNLDHIKLLETITRLTSFCQVYHATSPDRGWPRRKRPKEVRLVSGACIRSRCAAPQDKPINRFKIDVIKLDRSVEKINSMYSAERPSFLLLLTFSFFYFHEVKLKLLKCYRYNYLGKRIAI